MAAFGISDGTTPLAANTAHIDLTGTKPGDVLHYDVKWPDGNYRRFIVQIKSIDAASLTEAKADKISAAANRQAIADNFTAEAANDQAVLDLANAGEVVDRSRIAPGA